VPSSPTPTADTERIAMSEPMIPTVTPDEVENIPASVKSKIEETASKVAFNANRRNIKIFLLSTLAKYYLLDQLYKSLLQQTKEHSNG
jgi:hypothetical protein